MFNLNFLRKDNSAQPQAVDSSLMTLHGKWEQLVSEKPDAIAILGEKFERTRKELNQRAERIAHYLCKEKELSPGDGVALFCVQGENYVAALLGVLKSGCVAVPVDRGMRWDKANQFISECECKVILADKQGLEICRNMGKQNVGVLDEIVNDTSRTFQKLEVRATNDIPAFIMHTSGTTGFPKAVFVGHQGLQNMVMEQIRLFCFLSSDRILLYSSINFDSSLAEIFTGLFSGAGLVVAEPGEKESATSLRGFMQRNKVTVITINPGMLKNFSPADFSTLRVLVLAGEQLLYSQVKPFLGSTSCFNAYGLTETSVCVTSHKVDPKREYGKVVPIGKPISNVDICIMGKDLQPLPKGEVGEICVSGNGVSPGYMNNPGMTREKFIENPLWKGDTLFRTGDRGRLLPDDNLEFLGRLEEQGGNMESEKENIEEKDPRVDVIMEHMASEGYRPKIDEDGDIVFKREGKSYFIIQPKKNDPEYYCLSYGSFWSIENHEEYRNALLAGNKATKMTKVAKIAVYENTTQATIEIFAPSVENFTSMLERMIGALDSVVNNYVEEMRAIASKE